MNASFYSDPELYDLMFPAGPLGPFYAEQARLSGGPVLELACGSGQLLVPVAQTGLRAAGLDVSETMLSAASKRASEAGATMSLVQGDMRSFDLRERFALIFLARNSLLHLASLEDLLCCFECVRRHLLPGGAFAFDVFNPDFGLLARRPGRRYRIAELTHPRRGPILIDEAGDYDRATQVNRSTWYFSTEEETDFLVAPLHLRVIFPQELPLLLAAGGLELEERYGDFGRAPFQSASPHQVCICRPRG